MKVLKNTNFDEWQEIANKCEYATFFHTPIWSRIFTQTYKNIHIVTKKFLFDDETKVMFPLVLTKNAKGLFNVYISNVGGVYGGWISDKNLSEQQNDEIVKWINKYLKNFEWRINPFDKNLHLPSMLNIHQDFTQYLDLRRGFDSIYKSWTRGHAWGARKASKEGVIVREAKDWKDWKNYFVIYQDSIRRWGDKVSCTYPLSLFKEFFKSHSPSIKLLLAYFGDYPIAGILCFYHNHHVAIWHSAALEKYFPKHPCNILHYKSIKDACEKGYWWYDFNPSGGHKGVVIFKKRFGAKKLKSDIIYKRSFFSRLIEILPYKSIFKHILT